ncbi:hypothetical protein Nepgr_017582 [Nepenthes gracilis]|uniref:GDSL esterase/lipase n=1 Tax=Nepenthes gracilis TaxID=150966 RepID=A0AAD3SSW1_NEPGR|nr:hypothetical protein Nepgr_017582 [Nepenthes gracilis]
MAVEWRRVVALPLTLLVVGNLQLIWGNAAAKVPCFFIFGDSLSDSGNNNGLLTLAKANYLPYGIDFPAGPTGRFTNGRTTVDLIGEHMGLESYIPPFAAARGPQILKGLNYASGSAGILDETGQHVGDRIPMDIQLNNHQTTVLRIGRMLGNETAGHLKRCLYSVYVGSNDYMINYYMPAFYPTSQAYSIEQFTDALIAQYSRQLMRLHSYGARKVVLFGLSPLGCLPILHLSTDKCADNINSALQLFNGRVKSLVDEFNKNLNDAKFIFINTFQIVSENLSALGTKMKKGPCCGVREMFCLPYTVPCTDRNGFAYWDNAHPTEVENKVLAGRAYSAQNPDDTYPMDISHLVEDTSTQPAGGGGSQVAGGEGASTAPPSGDVVEAGQGEGPGGTATTPTAINGWPFGTAAAASTRKLGLKCWGVVLAITYLSSLGV